MKTTKILMLLLTMVAFSCSKDDDPQPLSQKTLSIGSKGAVVSLPAGLTNSTNEYAQAAVSYVELANSLSEFSAIMKVPSGAKKETNKITASNGRVAATTETYTWSDPDFGTIGYQITDTGTEYKFEFFIKPNGTTDWLKYLDGQEKKDGSQGYFKVYDAFLLTANASTVLFNYEWSTDGDNFIFKLTSFDEFYMEMNVNKKTKAGTVSYFVKIDSSFVKLYHMTWDATGHGTWKFYDEDGVTVLEEGTW